MKKDIYRGGRPTRPSSVHPTWFTRAAETDLASINADDRTIAATIATENPVVVYDFASRRVVREVLIAAGGRLSRWVPLLDAHQTYSLTNSLGSVLESTRVASEIHSRLSFSRSADVEPIWERVRDGHLRQVSVGGRRIQFTDIEPNQTAEVAGRTWRAGKLPLRITTSWVLREASIVIFGADGGAATDL